MLNARAYDDALACDLLRLARRGEEPVPLPVWRGSSCRGEREGAPMDFPSYVPDAVRELIARAAEVWAAEGVKVEVETFQRLALRPEMQQAYSRLAGALSTDADLKNFIRAAWKANIDYGAFRDQLKEATEIAREVAGAAGKLHDLLRKAEEFDTYLPGEFFSIRSLLQNTDHDSRHRNHHMWRGMREFVLGDTPDQPPDGEGSVPAEIAEIAIVGIGRKESRDPDVETRDTLHYAWGTAPNMCHFIATMQRAAQDCVPSETGTISAGVSSRKRNRKTEYLRGFASLLGEYSIECSAEIMNAMAVTATVVLDDADTDVTYDDVRKAVAGIVNRGTDDSE